ncbi:MAG: polysaccharide biosynthesis C-terminal domain-containing protein, partial [Oscillospiraceae bacterium]|nr:polysaccharide biosynthesis C-terminal domain-containing protein [Oscillospiraceae bacterium]
SIFPAIAESYTKKDNVALKKHIEDVLFATMFIAAPGGFGLYVLSKPILLLLFPTRLPEVEIAYNSLAYLGIGVILCCISYPVFCILQAVGRADIPLKIMLAGVVVKLICNVYLIPIPKYNIDGAAIGTVLSYAVICILSFLALKKVFKIKLNSLKILWAPVYAGILCGVTAMLAYSFLHKLPVLFALPIAIGCGGFIYLLSCSLMSLPFIKKKK